MGMALTVPRYTVDDLDRFPDDGNRYELLDGVLMVTPAPGGPHQGIAARFAIVLGAPLVFNGHANIYTPGAISYPPQTQLEPDVLVVPARFLINTPWVEITEHWLAIEVFSRSSRVYDREFKRNAYLDLGVQEVWLVDMREKFVEVCRVRGPGQIVRDVINWRPPTLDLEVTVDLGVIFAGLS